MAHDVAGATSPRPDSAAPSSTAGAPSALSPDAAWMLPPESLVDDVESAFTEPARPAVPSYGGLRYTAAWWAARSGH